MINQPINQFDPLKGDIEFEREGKKDFYSNLVPQPSTKEDCSNK